VASSRSAPTAPYISWAPEVESGFPGQSHQSGVEGQNPLPGLAALGMQPRVRLAFCAASAHGELLSSFPSPSPSRQGCSASLHPPACTDRRRCRDPSAGLALPLVEPHEVHTGPALQLVQVPLDGTPSFWCVCTTQLGVICKLAEGALNLVMSLMKILNSTGPSMDPSGTPPVTNLHLDIKPLTTTLWLQPSNQFLIHPTVHPSNPYLPNLERRMLWGTVLKALQKSRQITSIALPLSTDAVTPL